MEDCVIDNSISNGLLSQSYSQGIERITGTKHHIFNFRMPKELLKVREKSWDNLFDKYSEKMSDDIEINVETLEPEEEDEGSEEEYSCGRRVPMRKPSHSVQYWIDTGNPPHEILQHKNDLSETGSSLSEKEISPQYSSTGNKQKYKNDSSCTSVNTAAYILSNTNITKKADAIAIIEGAKRTDVRSSKNDSLKDTGAADNDERKCTGSVKTDQILHNNNDDINVGILDSDVDSILFSMGHNTSTTNNHPKTNAVISNNTVQSKSLQSLSCDETDKVDSLNTNEKSLDVQRGIRNIVSIFQQFDKTSKLLSVDGKSNSSLDESESLEKCSSENEQLFTNVTAEETIAKDVNLARIHRKKLYTGRESPVDLILIERHSINKLPKAKLKLHPALDTDSTIKSKISTVHKEKNKHHSLLGKSSGLKKTRRRKRKRSSSFSSVNVTDSNDEINGEKVTNSSKIQDSIDSSIKNAHNNLAEQHNDVPIKKHDDANVPVRMKTRKQDLISVNLNPVVLLERITPSLKRREFESVMKENTQISNEHNNMDLNTSNDLRICLIENLHEETIDSNESSILICECKKTVSSLSSGSSYHLRLSTESEFSFPNRENGTKQELNLENTNEGRNREPRVILQRLPGTVIRKYVKAIAESEALNINKDLSTDIKTILNKSVRRSSASCGTKKTDNLKLRELKIVLERSLENICFQWNNNITNTRSPVNKIETSLNAILENNKGSQITTKILTRKNTRASVKMTPEAEISTRMHTESKKADDKIRYTSDTAAKHENQVCYDTDTDTAIYSTSRQKDHTEVKWDKRDKGSSLIAISSDEDSLVQLIQPSRKRLKMFTQKEDDAPLDTSLVKNNLSGSSVKKQMSKKSSIGSSFNTPQQNSRSTITELVMFQTRSYYDSDSSEKS